jgi:osmotically-inducible protein OsmY
MLKRLLLLAVAVALAGCATDGDARSAAQQIEDTVLISRVKTALIGSDETDGTRIEVDAFRGRVQLEGSVDSLQEREAATRIAEGIDGVTAVENNLDVAAVESPPAP